MNGVLNKNQLDYVFYHLNHHIDLNKEIRNYFVFEETGSGVKGKIIFRLSENSLGYIKSIQTIPILFPLGNKDIIYSIDKNKNLIFHHDLIKSAFYLLSGYQETQNFQGDEFGRFTYKDSIQKKINSDYVPLVNEYFELITTGLENFCKIHGVNFCRKDIWGKRKFGFMLTHDVDRVDKWTIHLLKLRIKQFFGLKRANIPWLKVLHLLIIAAFKILSKENPFWNFEWLKKVEHKFGFVSTWFFLPQGLKHIDAYYYLSDERLRNLIQELKNAGDEIGLHATYRSITDIDIMKRDLEILEHSAGSKPLGVRQHWLRFKYPETLRLQQKLGLSYDSSWMFADQMGWRNSYCLPFRPYDLNEDRMMNIWEIPLCYMDNTPLKYQKLNLEETRNHFEELLSQVIRYRGLFVMLWHNNYFDEDEIPGITRLYLDLLAKIASGYPESLLPTTLVERLESPDYK